MDDDVILAKAQELLESGSARDAHFLIQPLLKASQPDALFLYSTYSVDRQESDEEFEKRSISLLIKASTLGHVRATFALAGYYDSGDMVLMDKSYAAQLFKKAADGGHAAAKLIYGLDLFYGAHGIRQDKSLGRQLIERAAQDSVDGASEWLEQLHGLCRTLRQRKRQVFHTAVVGLAIILQRFGVDSPVGCKAEFVASSLGRHFFDITLS